MPTGSDERRVARGTGCDGEPTGRGTVAAGVAFSAFLKSRMPRLSQSRHGPPVAKQRNSGARLSVIGFFPVTLGSSSRGRWGCSRSRCVQALYSFFLGAWPFFADGGQQRRRRRRQRPALHCTA